MDSLYTISVRVDQLEETVKKMNDEMGRLGRSMLEQEEKLETWIEKENSLLRRVGEFAINYGTAKGLDALGRSLRPPRTPPAQPRAGPVSKTPSTLPRVAPVMPKATGAGTAAGGAGKAGAAVGGAGKAGAVAGAGAAIGTAAIAAVPFAAVGGLGYLAFRPRPLPDDDDRSPKALLRDNFLGAYDFTHDFDSRRFEWEAKWGNFSGFDKTFAEYLAGDYSLADRFRMVENQIMAALELNPTFMHEFGHIDRAYWLPHREDSRLQKDGAIRKWSDELDRLENEREEARSLQIAEFSAHFREQNPVFVHPDPLHPINAIFNGPPLIEDMFQNTRGVTRETARLEQEISGAVEKLDMREAAQGHAESTVQGFLDGFDTLPPRLADTMRRMGGMFPEWNLTLRPVIERPMPGYAAGTPSARPGWALVGERGPELVRFEGGEQVFTANETNRILASPPESWDVAPTAGGGAANAPGTAVTERKITLDINGGGTIEFRARPDRREMLELLVSNVKPVLMDILSQEVFEEGDLSYEF